MKNPPPSRFEADAYRKHRPLYPDALFQELKKRLSSLGKDYPISIVDLGCGSGQSFESFCKSFPSVLRATLVDPDTAMLEECRSHFRDSPLVVTTLESKAEEATFSDHETDGVLIGSALHWMRSETVIEKIRTAMKKDGFIFVFEYQFPRTHQNSALNDWIRKKFNSEWRAPGQSPRGSFRDLLAPFDRAFSRLLFQVPNWETELNQEDFLGQLFSQSRYLHSESTLNASEVTERRREIQKSISEIWGTSDHLRFDFYLDAALYIYK